MLHFGWHLGTVQVRDTGLYTGSKLTWLSSLPDSHRPLHPSIDSSRGDRLSFDPECYCGKGVPIDEEGLCTGPDALQNRLSDWNEWYVDIHSKRCKKNIQKVMKKRILEAAKKGCDGVDPDNVDEVSFRTIPTLLARC